MATFYDTDNKTCSSCEEEIKGKTYYGNQCSFCYKNYLRRRAGESELERKREFVPQPRRPIRSPEAGEHDEVFLCIDCGEYPRTGHYMRCTHCADNRWRRGKGLPEKKREERANRGWDNPDRKRSKRAGKLWSGNPNTKFCHRCQEEKPITEFQTHHPILLTHQRCRSCLSTDIKLTRKSSEELKGFLGDHCHLCGKGPLPSHRSTIDHCHKTGRIRGRLCQSCNTAEGLLNSDPELIRKLALYVEEHSGKER